MIILIGGESCTGKTVMAQKLLEKYRMPYLSLDHLKMGLYRVGDHCGFTPESGNEIIESKLWPIVKGSRRKWPSSEWVAVRIDNRRGVKLYAAAKGAGNDQVKGSRCQ